MDIDLGKLNLTINQLKRSQVLKFGKIKGFSIKNDGTVIAVIDSDVFTIGEKNILISNLNALDDTPMPKTRIEELGEKPTLTLPEVTEVLKLRGLV